MEEEKVIIDTDFLSSFLKINKLDLIFKLFKTNELIITTAVFKEITVSSVYRKVIEKINSKTKRIVIHEAKTIFSEDFGAGELESIALSLENNATFLTNDQDAKKFAKSLDLFVLDIPTFLEICKYEKILNNSQIKDIIKLLKEKDGYEFKKEIKDILLK